MKSVELFAGAGGLALGVAEAGFKHHVVIECNPNAVESLRWNKARKIKHLRDWEIFSEKIEQFDYSTVGNSVALVSGGPPCQPFSLGGKHRGHKDERNLFPEVCKAITTLHPKAFIIENVKGLLRKTFKPYFDYIVLQLSYPHIARNDDEPWENHFKRLEDHSKGNPNDPDGYLVAQPKLLNAANFGVPQKRERVFFVGIRKNVGKEFVFPKPTHSEELLIFDKFVSREYWERFEIPKKKRPEPTKRENQKIRTLEKKGQPPRNGHMKPWVTVRDALAGLPQIGMGQTDPNDPNHFLNPGARSYPGHTGSPYDQPAKTLKAGVHGVPGGENTLQLNGNGKVRYFSVREAACLQTFPKNYVFQGSWTEAMRQLGNAVPVELAKIVATEVYDTIS